MSNFFIIGLLRSRTAWLANFMTYGKSFCYHEGINGCNSMEEYRAKIGSGGDSGPSCIMIDYKKYFPKAKKLIIENDPVKSISFLQKTYGIDGVPEVERLSTILDGMEGMRVKFESINDRLPEIWAYLSDEPYNKLRGDMLIKLNVQMNDPFDIDLAAMKNIAGELVKEA